MSGHGKPTARRFALDNHVIQTLQEAQWGPAPPMLPAGAQIAVLAGDPTKPVPYTLRLKFPANYTIPPHSHPTDEHVVVISGALTFGMGDTLTQDRWGNQDPRRGRVRPDAGQHESFCLHRDASHDDCAVRARAGGIQVRQPDR
jgi:ChrR Cupin-like domain